MKRKNRSMMRCRECGLPRLVSFFVKWKDNGTMVQLVNKDFRAVILHHGFLDNLFSSIQAKLGLSIEHIAFEAQRNVSKATYEVWYRMVPGSRYAVKLKFLRRIAVGCLQKVATMLGMCDSEIIEYVPGKYGVARIRNPFHMGLMAANTVGAFEVLEGVPFRQTWEQEAKDTYILRIETTSEEPEIADRMKLDYTPQVPGNLRFERCPRCNAPRVIANSLKWFENDGIIVDTRTGSRVIFLDGYMVTTVFREMACEIGDEIYDLVVEAQKDWTIDNVGALGLTGGERPLPRDELEAAYRNYLDMLPLYGYGNPVSFSMDEAKIEVVVENPYEPSILAGTFQGLYEALEKGKSLVSWEKPSQGVASFIVEPSAPGD